MANFVRIIAAAAVLIHGSTGCCAHEHGDNVCTSCEDSVHAGPCQARQPVCKDGRQGSHGHADHAHSCQLDGRAAFRRGAQNDRPERMPAEVFGHGCIDTEAPGRHLCRHVRCKWLAPEIRAASQWMPWELADPPASPFNRAMLGVQPVVVSVDFELTSVLGATHAPPVRSHLIHCVLLI